MQIIAGYLRAQFAQDKPLSLAASLCFEQSYSGVDGDSASAAEIYALLSVLAGLPLRQDVAVTGSVNQQGDIQPIGGVNEKIEGFFDVCRAAATGTQGVLIPIENIEDLMLRDDVIEAVAAGKFHVYPLTHIEEGIEFSPAFPQAAATPAASFEARHRLRARGRTPARDGCDPQAVRIATLTAKWPETHGAEFQRYAGFF